MDGGHEIIRPDIQHDKAEHDEEADYSDDSLVVSRTQTLALDDDMDGGDCKHDSVVSNADANTGNTANAGNIDNAPNVASGEPCGLLQYSYEQVVAGMRRLNLDVKESALAEAFAKLRINGGPPAPHKSRNPIIDEDEEGDEEDIIL
jgi:hypothetical protein